MKNKFALLSLLVLFITLPYNIYAQDADMIESSTEEVMEEVVEEVMEEEVVENSTPAQVEQKDCSEGEIWDKEKQACVPMTFHQIIKQKFIEGGPGFMGIVLLCLILGLALAIERIIYLNMATTNTD